MTSRLLASGVADAIPALWRGIDDRRRLRQVAALVPLVVAQVAADTASPAAAAWVVHSSLVSRTKMSVVKLGPPGREPVAVLKVPGSAQGALNQRRATRALADLLDETIGGLATLIPTTVLEGPVAGRDLVVESALPGVPADRAAPDGAARLATVARAACVIGELHSSTARRLMVGDPLLCRWVDDRVAVVATSTRRRGALGRLRHRLRSRWEGRMETVGRVHGDFWLGNVLLGEGGEVTGIVDWEWSGEQELPAHDIVYGLLENRMQSTGYELGQVVVGLLGGAGWAPGERAVLQAAGLTDEPGEPSAEVLLLVWLRQVAFNVIQDPGMARHPLWVHRNVDSVLRLL